MIQNRSALPPLDYLLAFESAAEHESFARAARELFISEAAISRKIKLLEQHYSTPLFTRNHRSVALTLHGKQLQQSIKPPLNALAEASLAIKAINGTQTITLAATHSVASLWLLPKIHQFNERYPNIELSLVASDSDQVCLSNTNNLIILRGNGHWPGYNSTRLFGEQITPVCSPDYLKNSPINKLDDIANHQLINVSNRHIEWPNWKNWLNNMRMSHIPVKNTILVNTYPLAIQAAINGLGIALGWKHLVDQHIKSGELIRPLKSYQLKTKSGYYLLRSQSAAPNPARVAVESWLLAI